MKAVVFSGGPVIDKIVVVYAPRISRLSSRIDAQGGRGRGHFDDHPPGRAVILSRREQLELGEWLPKANFSSGKSHISSLEDNEKEHIIKALERTGWRVSGEKGAAKILNINPKTLQSRMRKLSIHRQP